MAACSAGRDREKIQFQRIFPAPRRAKVKTQEVGIPSTAWLILSLGERSRERIAPHEHFADLVTMPFFVFGNQLQQSGDVRIISLNRPHLLHQITGTSTFLLQVLEQMFPTALLR